MSPGPEGLAQTWEPLKGDVMKNLIASLSLLLLAAACASSRAAVREMSVESVSSEEIEKVYFDFGQALVRSEDDEILKTVTHLLQGNGTMAVLVGHTDSQGLEDYNELLGEERARAVRVRLRDLGVDPSRVTVIQTKGSRELAVAPDVTLMAHRLNRRVEIVVIGVGSDRGVEKTQDQKVSQQ